MSCWVSVAPVSFCRGRQSGGGQTDLDFEAVGEIDTGAELEADEHLGHELGSYGCDARDLRWGAVSLPT